MKNNKTKERAVLVRQIIALAVIFMGGLLLFVHSTFEILPQTFSSTLSFFVLCAVVFLILSFGFASKKGSDVQTNADEIEQYFNNTIDMFCIADVNGLFRKLNPEWERTLGYSIKDLLGKPFLDFVHPDDKEATIKATQDLANNQTVSGFVNRYKHKDGTYLWIEWRSFPVGDMIYASARDITVRKNMEDELAQANAFHEAILENAGYAIITTSTNGVITRFNKAAEHLLGYSSNEVVQKVTPENFHDVDEVKKLAAIHSEKYGIDIPTGFNVFVMNNIHGLDNEQEWTFIRKDKSRVSVWLKITSIYDKSAHVIGYMGIASDISERKQAAETLLKNEQRLKRAQSVGKIGYSEYNLQTEVNWVSEEGLKLYGIDSATGFISKDLIKNTLVEFDMLQKAILNMVATGQKTDIEYTVRPQNGEPDRIFHSIAELAYDSEGKPLSVHSTFQDITDRKAAEAALKNSEQKYRLLFENMPSGFALHEIICDDEGKPLDYKYLEVNPGFEKLTGISASVLLGKTVKEIMPATEHHWIETFGKVAITGAAISYMNYSQELGKYFDTYAFSPQKNQFAVVFTDVTDKILAEQQLKESEKKFRNVITNVDIVCFALDQNGVFYPLGRTRTVQARITPPDKWWGSRLGMFTKKTRE